MSTEMKKELLGLSLFGLFLFLFFSLISYHPLDLSFSTSSLTVHNYCGKAGSYVADLLIQLTGLSSYLILLYVLALSLILVKKRKVSSYFTFFAGLTFLFVSTSTFLQLWIKSVSIKGVRIPASGLIGVIFERSFVNSFGYFGSHLILAFVLVFSFFLLAHAPLISILEKRLKGRNREEKREIRVVERQPYEAKAVSETKKEFKQEPFEFLKNIGPYKLPSVDLLDPVEKKDIKVDKETINLNARILEKKLKDYGIEGEVKEVSPGPVITLYEFEPAPGIKISRIANLADDLAMALSATSIRIVAPIPGKSVVGIEIPNPVRQTVYLREIIESKPFIESESFLTLALGKTIYGEPFVADLTKMPHLLVAGSTGSGKSVSLNSMICSILFKASPLNVRFLMIDLKMLELSFYEGIPHLLLPVVTNPKNAKLSLRWLIEEMERRYTIMAEKGVRNIEKYNQKMVKENSDPLPYIVVVIDELADLMMVSTREVEEYIARLAQMARASGIHLIIATQRPSVDVLTGIIKANFPARISFQVSSKVDSRTILDTNGAESLLGQGDMLFLGPGAGRLQRIHGPFVSENEIRRIVEFLKAQGRPSYQTEILKEKEVIEEEEFEDEKYEEAKQFVMEKGEASISMIQRRFRIGYNRAARIMERMEKEGIVGPSDGVKPREVLKRK